MTLGRSFFSRATTSAVLAMLVLPAGWIARGQADKPAAPDDLDLRFANGIAAIAEDKVITVDEIRREIAPMVPQIRRESRNEKEFNEKLEALHDDVIQNLIDRVLIVKDFKKDEKHRIPESYIDDHLSEIIIEQFDNDRSKFLAYLRGRGTTLREYRKEIEEDIIYNYMRQQQRKSQSIVSPVKVETFYNENKEKFYQEDSVHLRLIQFRRGEGDTDGELRGRAEAAMNRVKAGESFEDVAKDVSQDARRSKGGDWGWQKRSDLKPELSDPVFNLKKGEMSEPVIMPEGAFLLYVDDRKYAGQQPIEEVRPQIEQILSQQMARTNTERWLERLRRNGYVRHY
jgi:peptidyl-prolyl cis-trans isomerase SurA